MNIITDVRSAARKFVAATSREALRLAREALGSEAMVLTNRVVAEGVEIVAMAPEEMEQVAEHATTVSTAAVPAPAPAPAAVPVAAAAAAAPLPAPMATAAMPAPMPVPSMPQMPFVPFAPARPVVPVTPLLQQALPAAHAVPSGSATEAPATATPHADPVLSELHSMRGMIEEQLATVVWNDRQRRDPMRGRLLRTLLGAGFSARLAKAMLEHLPANQSYAQGMAFVRSELVRTVPVMENEDALLAQGGVYALMGPTGVGKTTTTAKLAARCVMRFGADKLALVTTDSYRIGAYEQLRIYGQILNVPVYAVKDATDLQLVLNDLRNKHMVLIDTVGMSQRDRAVSEQIAMLGSSPRPVKRLLLLNAASHGDTLNEVVHAYRHGASGNELAGCIFTKVDEATHPGALIDTVIRHRLPVHYVSSGQKVPENLAPADRAALVDSVFQAKAPSALFVPGESDLQDRPAAAEDASEVAQAQAETERLRLKYQQLIHAMAHDAQEVAWAAQALASADLGFDAARELWRMAADENVLHKTVLQSLKAHAWSEIATGCDRHVLALGGQLGLKSNEGGDAYGCEGSLLLSDRDGRPLAAPNQWLSTAGAGTAAAAARRAGLRPLQWVAQQDFGKPVVHALPRLPAVEFMGELQARGLAWLARAPGSTAIVDEVGGRGTLARLALAFGEAHPVRFKGAPALQAEAHAEVLLRGEHGLPALRCVVTRVMEPRSRKILAQGYLLSNIGSEVGTAQLAQWQAWAAEAEPCFRLIRQGLQLVGGMGELGDPHMMKRVLIAGQASTTVWRLLHAEGEWAGRTRSLLSQLTGRRLRPDRAPSGNVLYEGVAKMFLLLEALGS
ncbi:MULTISPECIES: flagellar biosynthesis protein FlhF [unclassified Variovorax]|uniref:flagellar biosynthesis protein FlhF n=1 Tax=unclassified Variovorax TaxID=663243 RepID=UPI00076DAE3E|nr:MULTISPECIES: flagellar biosynthesis protein FlhF [unclassified Variovorax]KWT92132.1 Flagellar biosynthesis protein FlhF [Variovorax sp. WDL1]PNG46965.1 Flagellar biosynthesis protein FlhF [Variovorax sp. B2]PNG48384.1 Flagellar biosynthesis protein FlhF [Variovorax sp. B4]VTV14807.1 Flagella-associated GTP-binding protein [Variovorax sp. WDL1]